MSLKNSIVFRTTASVLGLLNILGSFSLAAPSAILSQSKDAVPFRCGE